MLGYFELDRIVLIGFMILKDEIRPEAILGLDLVRKADFEGAYTFIYSKRKGTPAATYDNQIDPVTAKRRLWGSGRRVCWGRRCCPA